MWNIEAVTMLNYLEAISPILTIYEIEIILLFVMQYK